MRLENNYRKKKKKNLSKTVTKNQWIPEEIEEIKKKKKYLEANDKT